MGPSTWTSVRFLRVVGYPVGDCSNAGEILHITEITPETIILSFRTGQGTMEMEGDTIRFANGVSWSKCASRDRLVRSLGETPPNWFGVTGVQLTSNLAV